MKELPPGKPTLYLVDGSSYLYRAFFALPRLATSGGEPTGAIFGFATMLRRLRKEHRPDLLVVCFDLPGKTERHEAFEDYKAHRKPMPDELSAQVEPIHELVRLHRIPLLEQEGQEADDVMGTLAVAARAAGWRAILVTSDKDMLQLVDDGDVLEWHTGKEEFWGRSEVEANWGIPPERMIDVLALMGDSSDNVPGVKGIGQKGAVELVSAHGPLEEIYAHLDDVKPAHRKKLEADREMAFLSKQLVTIRTDLAIPFDPDALRAGEADDAELLAFYRRWELRRLVDELAASVPTAAAEAAAQVSSVAYEWTTDPAAIARAAGASGPVAVTAIGKGAGGWSADPIAAAIATDDEHALLFPLTPELAAAAARALAGHAWIGDDTKQALHLFARAGARLPAPAGDLGLASYVLNPGGRAHGFADVLLDRAGLRAAVPRDVLGKDEAWPPLPPSGELAPELDRLVGEPAARTTSLLPPLEAALADDGLDRVYRELELPLVPVLAAMEEHGISLDVARLAELSKRISADLERLEREVQVLAGESFNLGSPQQLGRILFEKLGYKPTKKTAKTKAYSTGVEVLQQLAAEGKTIAALVLEWREVQKLQGTYVDALPRLVDAAGVLHSSFHQTVAATGRLSSADPNLQNIPVRTELGREIRGAFVAPPGRVLVSLDYSQIELRLLAHFSRDPELVHAFRDGADVHAATAARVFGVAAELVTADMRRSAKTINFGILYGMGAFSLAKDLGVSNREAKEFIDSYFARFPTVRGYLDETLETARQKLAVRTLFGRVRRIPELASGDRNVRANAERMALNAPLQGSAADLMKLAMIRVAERLEGSGAAIVLSVHDELVLEVPEAAADEVAESARREMEGVAELEVPLVVEVGRGRDWLEAKA